MYNKKELEQDLKTLNIQSNEELSVKYVTICYKRVAKEKHPDKGGEKDLFQELQAAYKRVVEHLEVNKPEKVDYDYEKEFFVKNNIVKECMKSFGIYVQEEMVQYWKIVFQKHLKVHRSSENSNTIFKTGAITLTLYEKPKVDQRSKIHIQGKNQALNLEFILEKLSLYYHEARSYKDQSISGIQYAESSDKVVCSQCGKQYISKKGLKAHVLRIHAGEVLNKTENPITIRSDQSNRTESTEIILEEDVETPSQMSDIIIDAVFNEINKQSIVEQITNFQCGDCGNMFKSASEVRSHVHQAHNKDKGSEYDIMVKNLQDLKEANEILVTKNVSLDKEVKRMKLAFTESEYGKSEIMKELKLLRENAASMTRENEILKEEIRVKAETIQLLKGTRDATNDSPVANNDHSCPDCDFKCSDIKNLQEHVASHVSTLNCPECDESFESYDLLEDHFLEKHVEEDRKEEYTCSKCESKFISEEHLKKHVDTKHKRQTSECNICGEIFNSKKEVEKHTHIYHKTNNVQPIIKRTSITSHECTVCKSKFKSKLYLQEHIKHTHNTDAHHNNTNSSDFNCRKCGRIFESKTDVEKHHRNCNEEFTSNRKECRYYRKGSCKKGDNCLFKHTKPRECRNGSRCRYWLQGRCKFGHQSPAHVPVSQMTAEQGFSGDFRYCMFGAQCRNLPYCPLLHYNLDFPHLPANRSHPMGTRQNVTKLSGRH